MGIFRCGRIGFFFATFEKKCCKNFQNPCNIGFATIIFLQQFSKIFLKNTIWTISHGKRTLQHFAHFQISCNMILQHFSMLQEKNPMLQKKKPMPRRDTAGARKSSVLQAPTPDFVFFNFEWQITFLKFSKK